MDLQLCVLAHLVGDLRRSPYIATFIDKLLGFSNNNLNFAHLGVSLSLELIQDSWLALVGLEHSVDESPGNLELVGDLLVAGPLSLVGADNLLYKVRGKHTPVLGLVSRRNKSHFKLI